MPKGSGVSLPGLRGALSSEALQVLACCHPALQPSADTPQQRRVSGHGNSDSEDLIPFASNRGFAGGSRRRCGVESRLCQSFFTTGRGQDLAARFREHRETGTQRILLTTSSMSSQTLVRLLPTI